MKNTQLIDIRKEDHNWYLRVNGGMWEVIPEKTLPWTINTLLSGYMSEEWENKIRTEEVE